MSAAGEQGHRSTYTPLDAFRLDDGRVMVRLGIEGHRIPEEFVPMAEVERLREALRTVADHIPNHGDPGGWKHWATLAAEALEASSELRP